MNTRTLAASIGVVVARMLAHELDENRPDRDDKILALVLKQVVHGRGVGGYTVVRPDTHLRHADPKDPDDVDQAKKYVREHLQTDGVDIAKLVDRLFAHNSKPVRLSLKSSPSDGYVVDYDGKFANYFTKGNEWDQFYKENRGALGMTRVSLPAFDPASGLLLVYVGTTFHWLNGSGWIVLYRVEKGHLKELRRVMMVIS